MQNNLLLFGSMTAVMKARELLRRNGIRSLTIRTPAEYRRGSCGYSLLVKDDFDKAHSIVRQHNLPLYGVAAVDYP